MSENLRFIQVLEVLIASDEVSNYTAAATLLQTNRAGINDIRSGRKKLSIDLLRRLKQLYPDVSLDYVIMGEGTPFNEKESTSFSDITHKNSDLNNSLDAKEVLKQDNSPIGVSTVLLSILREKDERILLQSEEIGRLKERLNII